MGSAPQFVLGAAGAAAGFFIGGPSGAFKGAALGFSLGGAFVKPPTIRNSQQPMSDLRLISAEYGQPIPYLIGSAMIAGQLWWNTDRRIVKNVTRSSAGGGKGAKKQTTENETITYDIDCILGLTNNEIDGGVIQIFDQGKLIATFDVNASAESLVASASAETWNRITIYKGTETQMPDPTYEAAIVAEGKRPTAYRGRSYLFIEALHLGSSGAMRNLTAVVVEAGTSDTSTEITPVILGTNLTTDTYSKIDYMYAGVRGSGLAWIAHQEDEADESVRLINMTTGAIVHEFTQEDAVDDPTPQTINPFVPVGIMSDNGVLMRNAGSNNIITKFFADGSVGHINPLFDASSAGLAEDSDGNLWGLHAINLIIERINSPIFTEGTPSGPSTSPAFEVTPGAGNVNRWARNPGGIEGHVIGISNDTPPMLVKAESSGAFFVDYLGSDEIATNTQVVVGDDGFIYTVVYPGAGISTIQKRHPTTGVVVATLDISGGATLEPHLYDADGFLWVGGQSDQQPYRKIRASDMTLVATIPNDDIALDAEGYRKVAAEPFDGVVAVDRVGFGGLGLIRSLSTISQECVPLHDAVSRLLLRCGMTAGQFNVVPLETITREVCSLAVAQIVGTRSPLELLISDFFFGMTVSNKLTFVPFGVSPVRTLSYLDLGAGEGEPSEPISLKLGNDLELPAQKLLTYFNIDNDYQTDTQPSDRRISSASGTVEAIEQAIGLHANEAKQVVDVQLLIQYIELLTAEFSLLGNHCDLEPMDPVIATLRDDSLIRLRIIEKVDSYPLLNFRAVLDDTSVLSSQGITSTDFSPQTEVAAAVDTVLKLLDIPILQDADDDAGFYLVGKGDDTPFPGFAVFDSPDNEGYTQRLTVRESGVIGTCETTLGDWTGSRVVDELNTVRVNVGNGTLSSSTLTAVLADESINAFAIGNETKGYEILQAITADLVSPGVYDLSRLLRGSRGTEWAMVDHVPGETCVLLREFGMRRMVLENSQLGIERFYAGVTLGRPLSSGTAQAFTNNAIGLTPFSPAGVRVDRDGSGNITFTVDRRSRLSVRTTGPLGISVPLGEDFEQYEIDVYAVGSPDSLVRTITGAFGTNVLAYSAADQIVDFASVQSMGNLLIEVYQRSATVGRGYPLEIAA